MPKSHKTDKATKNTQRWRRRNPIRHLLQVARRRARCRGLEFSVCAAEIALPEVCPLLLIPIDYSGVGRRGNGPSLDRIDASLGYVSGNVWVVSVRANRIKSDARLSELQTLVRQLEAKLRG